MEMFTIFGLAIFLFIVMVSVSLLLNIAFNIKDDEMLCGLGFIVVMLVLSFAISSFFIQPENFGYEKIVSNNSIEQEVMRND